MAYAMTKQGSLDNCVTYEFICDTIADMNAIENKYRTIGSVAVVLEGEGGGMEAYIAGSNKQWNNLGSMGASGSETTTGGLSIYICAQNEVSSGKPNIATPDETTIYLVSAGNESGNLYEEYIYVNNAWEKFGAANIDLSGYSPIANPAFTGSISLNRKTGTTAGTESIAVGNETAANGPQTVAFGRSTISNGDASFTCGTGLVAAGGSEFVIGTYNKLPAQPWQPNTAYAMDDYVVYHDKLYYCATPHTSASTFEEDSGWYHARKHLLTIGNGNNSSGRSNAFALDIWGDAHLLGDLYVGCHDDSQDGTKVATLTDISTLAPKANPEFTGSISMGRTSGITVGNNSVALGSTVRATGTTSFAFGETTRAAGTGAVAIGRNCAADASDAIALGYGAAASGTQSIAIGRYTLANTKYMYAGGICNQKDTYIFVPEWSANTSYQAGDIVKRTNGSTITAYQCTSANSDDTFIISKWSTLERGSMLEVIGNGTSTSNRSNARALDWDGSEYLKGELYVGCNADSTGGTKVATLTDISTLTPKANPEFTESISMGRKANTTIGTNSIAIGDKNEASGSYSYAEGYSTKASAHSSHAEGYATVASGMYGAHAEGGNTTASKNRAHAEGYNTTANGHAAHAEGINTKASGAGTHASGIFSVEMTSFPTWTANTTYNIGDRIKFSNTCYQCINANSDSNFIQANWQPLQMDTQEAFIVGNGIDSNSRSNALTLDWTGDLHLMGDTYIGCNADSTGGTKLARIPDPPTTDGTYTLQATVASGVITYTWVAGA